MKQLVFTVGNEMMGDDAAGPLLAQFLKCSPVSGWSVLMGGPVRKTPCTGCATCSPN